jgi:hypothetical protein
MMKLTERMTRESRIDAVLVAVAPYGSAEYTNSDGARLNPDRYLLVEKNVGSAADEQSHYFTTHPSLDEAWAYHDGQEYREDWEVTLAVDLDTGTRYVPGRTTVEWHEEVLANGNDR